ncbi:MAG: helix-turn-helix domain-containing protein [Clostridia bacterium]|nr:helix-turn-helix domain-containing protein [Clostridia bacterium]
MNNIKELRKERNLTQLELAVRFGIDQTTVSKWELNKALPDTLMLIQLAEFFDVSVDYLLARSTYYFPDEIYSEEEKRLIDNYRDLNDDGKKLVDSMIKTLLTPSGRSEQNNKIS